MMKTEMLKQALSMKAQTSPSYEPSTGLGISSRVLSEDTMQPIGITLTINISPKQAAWIQPIVGLLVELSKLAGGKLTAAQEKQNDHTAIPEVLSRPESSASPDKSAIQPQSQSEIAAAQPLMSSKQQGMIFALVAKKKLTPEQVEALLMKQVGHVCRSELTKKEASSLINTLLAM